MKITIVRHAQTEENFLNKIQGQSNKPLNDTGRRQAKNLSMNIKEKHYDYCYMSPLIRAVETALILIGDRVEMIKDDRLIERGMGELEGRPYEEYNSYRYWDYDLNWDYRGVEPIHDVFDRVKSFVDYIKEKYDDNTSLLIVTHGATYRALRYVLKGTELKGNMLDDRVQNCQIEEFEITK